MGRSGIYEGNFMYNCKYSVVVYTVRFLYGSLFIRSF